MSRRKQLNPKPLLKNDCQESVDEMTVERDNKEFCDKDVINETSTCEEIDATESTSSNSIKDNELSNSPRLISNNIIDPIELTNKNTEISLTTPVILATKVIASATTSASAVLDVSTEMTKNDIKDDNVVLTTSTTAVPKLRLNVSLASDPALKPDAKDIKIIQDNNDDDIDDNDNDDNEDDNDNDGMNDDNTVLPSSSLSRNETSHCNKNNIDEDEREILLRDKCSISMISTNNCTSGTILSTQITKPSGTDVVTSHRLKVFMCHPCGIGFSSHSTLEAHQKYYCSHRQEIDDDVVTSNNVLMTTNVDKSTSLSGINNEPITKSIKTGKQYACTQCSYSADKKVSLNRHMRMHQSSPTPSSNTSNGDECTASQQIDRYCSECDIRFSNVKTYRAHKQHYCSSRRTERQSPPKSETKKSGSISPQNRSKTPTTSTTTIAPPQPFLALPTNPILIIPYSVVRAASLLPGPLTSITSGMSNPDITCFSFENGTLNPIATSLNAQNINESTTTTRTQSSHRNTISPLQSEQISKNSNNIAKQQQSKKDGGSSRETVPLDLSVRKSPITFHKSSLDLIASIGGLSSSSSSDENKLDIEVMMEGKENLSILDASGKITPEQIVCSPSLPSSPSMSPSPKRRTSPRVNLITSNSSISGGLNLESTISDINMRSLLPTATDLPIKLIEANAISSLLSKQQIELALKLVNKPNELPNATTNTAVVATSNSPLLNIPAGNPISVVPPIPNVQPQIYVKQGVSKCKECNIVFCKFENYLAHKQHYCSARNQDENEIKVNTPPSTGSNADPTPPPPPVAYHQLICAACGIKYTSLDNLRAHQTFYCPKGGEIGSSGGTNNTGVQISIGKEKCSKCKITHDTNKPCSVVSIQGSYKCPVCGIVSLNAADSRKHLETHGSVKAFRCSICRYKGNTLRGMRTHIRMHFDKKSSDFNEESYMSCILEEDGVEISSTASINQDQNSQQQLFSCEICNYSSSYKGNVIRHMKLVHSQSVQSSSGAFSISPETGEGDETLSQNGDDKMNIKECFSGGAGTKLNELKNNEKKLHTTIIDDAISSKIKIEPEDVHDTNDTNNHQIKSLSLSLTALSNMNTTSIVTNRFSSSPLPILSTVTSSLSPSIQQQQQSLSIDENVDNQKNIIQRTTSTSSINNDNNDDTKYCRNCDIKFNYVNTYIAHKQFYCKSNNKQQQQQQRIEIKTPPIPASTVIQSSQSILGNNNKDKENVETTL